MKLQTLLAVAALASLTATVSNARSNECEQRAKSSSTEALARAYMQRAGLIRPEDEQNFPEIGVVTKWSLQRTVQNSHGCFVVMRIRTTVEGVDSWSAEADAFGLLVGQDNNADKIVPFERLRPVPKKLIVKIGLEGDVPHPEYGNVTSYYVKLTGPSVVDAIKSKELNMPYHGFRGVAVRGSKASFDPTPNRDWQIKNGTFSLRRGDSAEEMDIQAFQLDGMDESGAEAYWNGHAEVLVAPWGQAFVNELLE